MSEKRCGTVTLAVWETLIALNNPQLTKKMVEMALRYELDGELPEGGPENPVEEVLGGAIIKDLTTMRKRYKARCEEVEEWKKKKAEEDKEKEKKKDYKKAKDEMQKSFNECKDMLIEKYQKEKARADELADEIRRRDTIKQAQDEIDEAYMDDIENYYEGGYCYD